MLRNTFRACRCAQSERLKSSHITAIFLSCNAGSHWEQRILQTELMAPIVTGSTIHVSPMTLAAFEDSGWYTADYSQAATYVRGEVYLTYGLLLLPCSSQLCHDHVLFGVLRPRRS